MDKKGPYDDFYLVIRTERKTFPFSKEDQIKTYTDWEGNAFTGTDVLNARMELAERLWKQVFGETVPEGDNLLWNLFIHVAFQDWDGADTWLEEFLQNWLAAFSDLSIENGGAIANAPVFGFRFAEEEEE